MMNEKWNIKLRVLCACLVSFAASSVTQQAHAQTASDHNHGSQIIHDGSDNFTFSWFGHWGWTYFIQASNNLTDWSYVGYLEPGKANAIEYGFSNLTPTTGKALFCA